MYFPRHRQRHPEHQGHRARPRDAARSSPARTASYDLIEGLPPGHLEQDPADWIRAVDESVAAVPARSSGGRRRRSPASASAASSTASWCWTRRTKSSARRSSGATPRTAAQCEQIADEFGGQPGCIQLAGNAMLPGYTVPKILWLKQNEPKNFAKVDVDPAAARLHQFLAHRREAHGIRRRLRHGPPQRAHPRVVPRALRLHRPARARHAAAARLLAARCMARCVPNSRRSGACATGVVISAGGGDNMMGAIGTGNVKPGVVTASFGTSGTLYGVAAEPVIDRPGRGRRVLRQHRPLAAAGLHDECHRRHRAGARDVRLDAFRSSKPRSPARPPARTASRSCPT